MQEWNIMMEVRTSNPCSPYVLRLPFPTPLWSCHMEATGVLLGNPVGVLNMALQKRPCIHVDHNHQLHILTFPSPRALLVLFFIITASMLNHLAGRFCILQRGKRVSLTSCDRSLCTFQSKLEIILPRLPS